MSAPENIDPLQVIGAFEAGSAHHYLPVGIPETNGCCALLADAVVRLN
jgi:hypothetical protein